MIEKVMSYKLKGVEMNIDITVNELGMNFLVKAKGVFEHELEIIKEDRYNICWKCGREDELFVDIENGVEIKDIHDFNDKVISKEYISEEVFEQHMNIFKEVIIIMREIMDIKAYHIIDDLNNKGVALENKYDNNYEVSIENNEPSNKIISKTDIKVNYKVIDEV